MWNLFFFTTHKDLISKARLPDCINIYPYLFSGVSRFWHGKNHASLLMCFSFLSTGYVGLETPHIRGFNTPDGAVPYPGHRHWIGWSSSRGLSTGKIPRTAWGLWSDGGVDLSKGTANYSYLPPDRKWHSENLVLATWRFLRKKRRQYYCARLAGQHLITSTDFVIWIRRRENDLRPGWCWKAGGCQPDKTTKTLNNMLHCANIFVNLFALVLQIHCNSRQSVFLDPSLIFFNKVSLPC